KRWPLAATADIVTVVPLATAPAQVPSAQGRAASVETSPPAPAATVTWYRVCSASTKVAAQSRSASRVTLTSVEEPAQSPLQAAKRQPDAGVAPRPTRVPPSSA